MDQLWLKRNGTYTKSVWGGGETTEIFIYPEKGDYRLRNFGFRISSATVTQAESLFSSLPGFYRYLMPLSGTIELNFDGSSTNKSLSPFEVADFDGGIATKSYGTCRDFNLMINKDQGWSGQIDLITEPSSKQENKLFTGYFALEGKAKLEDATEGLSLVLNQGDFLMIKSESDFELSVSSLQPTLKLIKVTVTSDKTN
ncbi:HutD family protein [Sporolactobacillus sp. STCC-11]|uniref:HutD/Ves family protein n=1 Tax=Sporolactobacillus caesalpiniae TaxID=3230362 RepID=UPI003398200E